MAITSSYFSPDSSSSRSLSVTKPCKPLEPSSVVIMSLSDTAFISSSRIMYSLLLKPDIAVTSAPNSLSFFACGYAIAVPRPPPITATFFNPSSGVGIPKGPAKSRIVSPSFNFDKSLVVLPTA